MEIDWAETKPEEKRSDFSQLKRANMDRLQSIIPRNREQRSGKSWLLIDSKIWGRGEGKHITVHACDIISSERKGGGRVDKSIIWERVEFITVVD